jgi:hypothetical protein
MYVNLMIQLNVWLLSRENEMLIIIKGSNHALKTTGA